MAAFVVSLIPLMYSLEEKLIGFTTFDRRTHKLKLFTDDLRLVLMDVEELKTTYDVICKFEIISGLLTHRDPTRDKCQALPFGKHRDFQLWPEWVSVKNKIKVVGVIFSNNESFEK